jgi:hypothetical protein
MKNALASIFLISCYSFYIDLSAQTIPCCEDFQINTYTYGYQWDPAMAVLIGGDVVVCWGSEFHNESGPGIFGQLLNKSGFKIGSEFEVFTYPTSAPWAASVAALSNGGFVVCWSIYGGDESGTGILGQIFDAAGIKEAKVFQVNSYFPDDQSRPAIATFSDGRFVVCWTSMGQDGSGLGVFAQMFDSSGMKKGSEFRINTNTQGHQTNPVIASFPNGDFIVCWVSEMSNSTVCHCQSFDSFGQKKGGEFIIGDTNLSNRPAISITSSNEFVVCWVRGYRIVGQFFDILGIKRGEEFVVNTIISPGNVVATALTPSGIVVCWQGESEIYGQLMGPDRKKRNPYEFQINSYSANWQWNPAVVSFSDGNFLVSWQSMDQDGSGFGIFGKKYQINHPLKAYSLIEPANDASMHHTNLVFRWRQPSETVKCFPWELSYSLFLDTDPGFLRPCIISNIQDTTCAADSFATGTTYFWKVLAKNIAGDSLWSSNTNAFFVAHDAVSGVEEEHAERPKVFTPQQNYPNPFNPETTVRFDLPSPGFVTISAFDINGRLVRVLLNESRTAGSYSVKWDGKNSAGISVPSGIYICRMEVRSIDGRRFTQGVKMGLVR